MLLFQISFTCLPVATSTIKRDESKWRAIDRNILKHAINKFVIGFNVNISWTSTNLILSQVLSSLVCYAPNILVYGSPKCGTTGLQFLPTMKIGEVDFYSYFVLFRDAFSLFVVCCGSFSLMLFSQPRRCPCFSLQGYAFLSPRKMV